MHILRHLPFLETPSTVEVAGEIVAVRAYQIIAWVSLAVDKTLTQDAPRFPVVIDTGHSHCFSITEAPLHRWAGLRLTTLSKIKDILVNRQRVPLHACNL